MSNVELRKGSAEGSSETRRNPVSDFEPSLSDNRSDAEIAAAIKNALQWHVPLPETLHALVENGCITLKGEATWEYQRTAVEDIVRHLRGVHTVTNLVIIKSMESPTRLTDP